MLKTVESSGSVLIIGYDSWVTRMQVSGGFSIGAFLQLQRTFAPEP